MLIRFFGSIVHSKMRTHNTKVVSSTVLNNKNHQEVSFKSKLCIEFC